MNRFAIIGAGLFSIAGFVSTASAADLTARMYTKAPAIVAPVYNWSGLYVGLNGGGASSHECLTVFSVAGAAVFPNSEGCHRATGGLVGGQIGYRWQTAGWVFGLEAQGDWAGLKGSNPSLTAVIPYTNQTKVDALGLFTGQIGYAVNNILLYAKGGAAIADNKYSSFFPVGNIFAGAGVPFNQASETRWGGVAGAGLEYGFAPNWSVAAEYDHVFKSSRYVVFPASAVAVTRSDTISQDMDIGTVRVSYHFGGPVVAKY